MESFMSNEYLVAKYIASPTRMEPRNIGVFVQTENGWTARFLGEDPGGRLDLRRVRGVVPQTSAYEQWVEYWRHILANTTAEATKRALEESSNVNFVVVDGPIVFLSADAMVNAGRTLDYLYYLVVTEFPELAVEELSLTERVEDAIRRHGLRQNPHFSESPSVPCRVNEGLVEHIRPSFGYVNGREVYLQKVSLNPYRPETAQKEVHNAAWIFEMLRNNLQERECNSLVKVVRSERPIEVPQFSVDESLRLLRNYSEVVDVDNDESLERVFGSLAA